MITLFKKMCLIFLLLALIICCSAVGQCDVNEILAGGKTTSGIVSQIPYKLIGRNILIKTKINSSEKEYTFLLDTGATTVISPKIANELGEMNTSEINTIDAANITQKVKVVQLKSLKVGNVEVEDCGALVIDFSELESYGIKVDGLIGSSFLKFFSVRIDYISKVLTLSSKTDDSMISNRGYEVNLKRDEYGKIFARIKTSKISTDAEIDTGSSGETYITIPINFLKNFQPELNSKLVKTIGSGAGGLFGTQHSFYSRLSTLELGNGFKMDNIPVEFFEFPSAVISNEFLSHFVVTINYPQSKMWLEPNGKPFKTNINTFGFMSKKDENGNVKIIGLWEGSSAQKKGLRVGDIITNFNINGKDMNFEDVLEYLINDEDVELCLDIVNISGKKQEVVLKKTKLLPGLKSK